MTAAIPGRSKSMVGSATAEQALAKVVRLSAARVMTADMVAAAKWGTDQPIDDPVREKFVLDRATADAAKLGTDRATVRRVFEDQIAANKAVQSALYERWREHPFDRPTHRPDLAIKVRPVLDRIDSHLLTAIRQAQPLLDSTGCTALLGQLQVATSQAMGLDVLHTTGLARALLHTCPPC